MQSALLLALAASLAACHGKPEADPSTAPFLFQMSDEQRVDIVVASDGAPLAGALIVVRESDPAEPEGVGGVLWQGLTGADGHARGKLVRTATLANVVVTVVSAGRSGPYTEPSLQTTYGPFAPASWQVVAVPAVSAMNVTLTGGAL
jgi:hypothetical protein